MELVGARKRVMAHGAVSRRRVSVRRRGRVAVQWRAAGRCDLYVRPDDDDDDDDDWDPYRIALPGVSSRYRE